MTDRKTSGQAGSYRQSPPVLVICGILSLGGAATAAGEPVKVLFDVVPLAACREITTAEFAAANPGERLFEAKLEISTLLVSGAESDLDQFLFRFTSPGQHLRVADYEPKTTLASDYASTIRVAKKKESSKSAGLSVSGVWDHLISINGSGDVGSKDDLALNYELHPPLDPITASGTIARGSGVYFKVRPSRQSALEGSRLFCFVLRGPEKWRGDYLQVHCEASGVRRGVVPGLNEPLACGVRDFFVALYLAGDVEAKTRADQMVRAEVALQKALASYRAMVASERRSVVHQLAVLWERPQLPANLATIERLLFSPEPFAATSIPPDLPQPLAEALEQYLAARTELRGLSR